jgi:hypothetical protein
MRLTRDVLGAVVLGLAAVGVASAANISKASASGAAQHRNEATATEHLSKTGSLTFAPGDLSEGATVSPSLELSHGFELMEDLDSASTLAEGGGNVDTDTYLISQKPFSSYEAVVDSTSGDIGPTLQVDRIVVATSTVVQSSLPVSPIGFTRSLRWINTNATEDNSQGVRVMSGQCTTNCGPDDVYFIRGYETTYAVPRFNNFGSQVTVLLLQNPTNYTINAIVYFWDETGAPMGNNPFTLGPKQLVVFNTSATAPGVGGAVTIAHDGRYGDLSAKTVALEPATGFSFDSPALPRIR